MSEYHYLACDLGAESGRVMMGTLRDGRLTLEELHRFSNGPLRVQGTLRWDVIRIYDELKAGLKKAGARGLSYSGVSTDSWGVDYVYSKAGEPMLTLPYCYRDNRTDDGFARVFAKAPRELVFSETGIQFMSINTIYQLFDDLEHRRAIMDLAEHFLHIGNFINYLFGGEPCVDESLASTSQLYNAQTRQWSQPLIQALGLPAHVFPKIVPAATVTGKLRQDLALECGLTEIPVIATCTHDTAAAVVGVPGEGKDWAYLSSGTWSLLGVETTAPVITPLTSKYNFTNEAGLAGTTRLLKNIVGLWMVQECKRDWAAKGQDFNYDVLTRLAEEAPSLRSLVNPDDPRFAKPGEMPRKIQEFCRETQQPVPETPGEIIRCVLESLALCYQRVLAEAVEISGQPVNRLHIVGGGCKNRLLNQVTANATGLTVVTGPVEGTAIGNLLVQALALGHVADFTALRQIIKNSFPTETYQPQDPSTWQTAQTTFSRFFEN